MSTRVERYLGHLDRLSGRVEPEFFPIGSHGSGPNVTSIVYRDLPEPGVLTSLTYGLSLANHGEWTLGRPELCIRMKSYDATWGLAIAHLASTLAGNCPFCYGDTINFGEPITDQTRLSGFVVFAPVVLDQADFLNVLGEPEGALRSTSSTSWGCTPSTRVSASSSTPRGSKPSGSWTGTHTTPCATRPSDVTEHILIRRRVRAWLAAGGVEPS